MKILKIGVLKFIFVGMNMKFISFLKIKTLLNTKFKIITIIFAIIFIIISFHPSFITVIHKKIVSITKVAILA